MRLLLVLALWCCCCCVDTNAKRLVHFDRAKPRGSRVRVETVDSTVVQGGDEDHVVSVAAGAWDLRNAVEGVSHRAYTPQFTGTGVNVYVLDSGCELSHPAFARVHVSAGPSFVNGEPVVSSDVLGHGTHVLGIAAQLAPNATFTCVRVFGVRGSGTASGVAAAVDWVSAQCIHAKCVINFSGGSLSSKKSVLDSVAEQAVLDDLVLVSAAGNYVDSCLYTPGRTALGVGATSVALKPMWASFSATGTCVKVLAPGAEVLSAWPLVGYKTDSGTSMATPCVAAAMAQYRQAHPFLSAKEVVALFLRDSARDAKVVGVPAGQTKAFVSLPGGEGLSWIDAKGFTSWRAEWTLPLCIEFDPAGKTEVALSHTKTPIKVGNTANSLQLSCDGVRCAIWERNTRIAIAGDDSGIQKRRVHVDGLSVKVWSYYEDRWVLVMDATAAQAYKHLTFAGQYTDISTGCESLSAPASQVVEAIHPPCASRVHNQCELDSASAVKCKWYAPVGCRRRGYCAFTTRNLCARYGCRWRDGCFH